MAPRLPTDLERRCVDTLRLLAVDMVEAAQSGHPGLPLGAAHLAHAIFARMKHAPRDPRWVDRDRFILSAGHGSALLYSMLHLTGYDLSMDDLRQFRQLGSRTPGHPEVHVTPGVETTTGPLGQGFANGVGMALAERFLSERFNRPGHEIVNHRVYAIVSDGDLMEGISSEAGSLAGHMKLGKLTCLYDSNRISIEGSTDLAFTENVGARFESFGWHVQHCDGHDLGAIEAAMDAAEKDPRPSLIVARTHIGLDSEVQDSAKSHGSPLGAERTKKLKEKLGWPPESFHVPDVARVEYGRAVARGEELVASWKGRFEGYRQAHPEFAAEFERAQAGTLPADALAALPTWAAGSPGMATRQASGKCLHALFPKMPELIGGSADLAESNLTTVEGSGALGLEPGGRVAHFGVREHAMGSLGNGMVLHGGVRPYLGTFLVFTDYMRPAMRLAALQQLGVIYVMTHDSIGLGEDGPTHQPIEHVASLRAMPGMTVIRPADANETSEAWGIALQNAGPTVLALTRQKLPIFERPAGASAKRGAYILQEAPGGKPAVILIATGSEVAIALEAAALLAKESGPAARVVSMPSWELFAQQDAAWRESVLPTSITARVSVEAGTTFGWERHIGMAGIAIGIDRFGASGKFEDVYAALGITPRHVADAARRLVAGA